MFHQVANSLIYYISAACPSLLIPGAILTAQYKNYQDDYLRKHKETPAASSGLLFLLLILTYSHSACMYDRK